MRSTLMLICLTLCMALDGIAQIRFVNRNDLLANKDLHSAVPVGIADMNGDGLDDIVTLDEGMDLVIQYQTPDPSRPFVQYRVPVFIDNNEQNDISIADFNNDGANDILMVGSYDRVKVLYSIPHTYDFNLVRIVVTPFFSQGASTGDFNHDGWVDAVLLNDNGLNYTLMNDGTGNLVWQDGIFDFVTVPPSDNSGNYGCLYTDFDMDGDLDFYIAKCRQGVNSPADPRRINALFVNDGSGNYTENAAIYGLANGRQSWTADFADFDNDGDMDLFLTQHDVISELFENIDNDTFINITAQSGLSIGGIPLQGMFRDFDNDGFQDILVSGDRLDFYRNNGDKTFTRIESFGGVVFGTFGLGDFNQDGFTDVYASRVIPFNNPDLLREDILFLNEKNDNHFLSLRLQDTAGNPSAIGAMAILYGPWGIQVREVRGGEQYGVSNSHNMIFGLGQHTSYDSLLIRWPDGSREWYNDLEVDQIWSIRRGGCHHLPLPSFTPLHALCGEDSLVLHKDPLLEFAGWSTGSFADTLVIREAGLYYAHYLDQDGCPLRTTVLEVIVDPDVDKPVISYDGINLLCDGTLVELSLTGGLGYYWSTGDTTSAIQVSATGEYFAQVEGFCIVQESDTVYIEFIIPEIPVTTADTFKMDEDAILLAAGDSIVWFADPAGQEFLGSGAQLVLSGLTDTTTVYAANLQVIAGLSYNVGPLQHQGTTKYNAAFVNGGLLFDVLESILLEQVTLFTDSSGTRVIEITGTGGYEFFDTVYLDAGATVVDLNAGLPPGSYTISTNTASNMTTFGVASPYLWRSSQGVLFPYQVPGVLSITNSTFGSDFFYYFYDWKISTVDEYCYSEFVPATAYPEIKVSVAPDQVLSADIRLVPNPTTGDFRVIWPETAKADIILSTPDGKVILHQQGLQGSLDGIELTLERYPSGLYQVQIITSGKSFTRKIVRL